MKRHTMSQGLAHVLLRTHPSPIITKGPRLKRDNDVRLKQLGVTALELRVRKFSTENDAVPSLKTQSTLLLLVKNFPSFL